MCSANLELPKVRNSEHVNSRKVKWNVIVKMESFFILSGNKFYTEAVAEGEAAKTFDISDFFTISNAIFFKW